MDIDLRRNIAGKIARCACVGLFLTAIFALDAPAQDGAIWRDDSGRLSVDYSGGAWKLEPVRKVIDGELFRVVPTAPGHDKPENEFCSLSITAREKDNSDHPLLSQREANDITRALSQRSGRSLPSYQPVELIESGGILSAFSYETIQSRAGKAFLLTRTLMTPVGNDRFLIQFACIVPKGRDQQAVDTARKFLDQLHVTPPPPQIETWTHSSGRFSMSYDARGWHAIAQYTLAESRALFAIARHETGRYDRAPSCFVVESPAQEPPSATQAQINADLDRVTADRLGTPGVADTVGLQHLRTEGIAVLAYALQEKASQQIVRRFVLADEKQPMLYSISCISESPPAADDDLASIDVILNTLKIIPREKP